MTIPRLDAYTVDQLNEAANILAVTEALIYRQRICELYHSSTSYEYINERIQKRTKQIQTVVMEEFHKRVLRSTPIMFEVERLLGEEVNFSWFRGRIQNQVSSDFLDSPATYVTNYFRNFFNEETEPPEEEVLLEDDEPPEGYLYRSLAVIYANEKENGPLKPVKESFLKALALLYTTLVIQKPKEFRIFRKKAIKVGLQRILNSEDIQNSDKASLELACASLREAAEGSFSGNMLIKRFLAEAPQLFMYMFHLAKAEEKYAIAKNFIAALTDLPEPFASNIPAKESSQDSIYSVAPYLPYAIDYIMHWLVSLEGFSLEDIIIEKSSPEEDKEKLREEFRQEYKHFIEDLGKIYRSLLESQPEEWSCLNPLAIQLGLIPPVVLVSPKETETVKSSSTSSEMAYISENGSVEW